MHAHHSTTYQAAALSGYMWTVYSNSALNDSLSAAVEDPFDATDNCARTIGFSRIDNIVEAFGRAAAVMNAARDDAGAYLHFTACANHHDYNSSSICYLCQCRCPHCTAGWSCG